MMISTKGRYALRVMVDLAEHDNGEYVVLMDIAKREELSEKYLEGILATLSRAGFVQALRGRGGGYKLARAPETYTVGSILKLTSGSFAPVACLGDEENHCERADKCSTLPMWTKLNELLDEFFEGITLADLMSKPEEDEK
ncbi:MAG: RrF2 family transcriptional regulator [Clostridiales bacterium]|nr:RrF2 family transcriptional regulator [Clostridiales bacterium]